ncbi:MAG: hypothetical protein ACXAC0_07865 [Candidatus Thorarchaeota archaeon]
MKRRRKLGIVYLVCILVLPISVAANNQGLRWAVEAGDQFEFAFTLIQKHNPLYYAEELHIENETMYIEIDSLLLIPDNLQYYEELPSPVISLYYDNSTILSLSGSMVQYPHIGKMFISPVGNWHILSTLSSNATAPTTTVTTTTTNSNYESSQIDNLTHWGQSWTFSDSETHYDGIHAFCKADGVLGYYTLSIFDPYLVTISFIRLNPPDPIPPAVGIIEFGIVVGVVAAVVVILVTKRKT